MIAKHKVWSVLEINQMKWYILSYHIKYCQVQIPITKIPEMGKIDTSNTQIHDRSLSWFAIKQVNY